MHTHKKVLIKYGYEMAMVFQGEAIKKMEMCDMNVYMTTIWILMTVSL